MKRIPIKVARDLGKKLGMTEAILVFVDKNGQQHVVTWGKRYNDCVDAARTGNYIKRDILRWPNELCKAKPARQIRKEKEQHSFFGKNDTTNVRDNYW